MSTKRRTVACRGGDGSEVRFPMSAVRAYDTAQADAYRCTHDTSADPDRSGCSGDAGGGDSGASGGVSADECDPGYEGACLDPNASDYDCQGGSGDGPEYTGRVQVVGDDHYGLDRDGNGVGCE